MFRFFKSLFLVFITIALLFFSLLFLIAKYYNNEIKNMALEQINQQLRQPLEAKNIKLNAFSQFPSISLEFNNFIIKDPLTQLDTLIYSEKGYLNFDLYDIINEKYNVKKLILYNGTSKISVNSQGKENYLILKKNKDRLNQNFNFKLNQVVFKKFKILYHNAILKQDVHLYLKSSKLQGAFSEKEYELWVFSKMLINQFLIEGVNYIKQKEAQLETKLKITNHPFSLAINVGKLKLEKTNFTVSGFYSKGKKDLLDLTLKGNKIEISEVFSALPNFKSDLYKNYSSKGILNFNGNLKGVLNNNNKLDFSVNFNTKNAFLEIQKNHFQFEKINLQGNFNSKSQTLNISQFSTVIDSQIVSGDVKISNFKDPQYQINLNGKVDLKKIPELFKIENLNLKGISKFDLHSNIDTKEDSLIFKKLIGSLNCQNLFIENPSNKIQLQNILIALPQEQMRVELERGVFNGDTFSIRANWENWKQALFSDNKNISINYSAKVKQFHLDHFLNAISSKDSSNYKYSLKGSINAEKVLYKNLNFDNLQIKKLLFNEDIIIEGLSASSFGGDLACDQVNIHFDNRNSTLKIKGKVVNLSIPKTMLAFNDFKQDLILNEHIKGTITSEFNLNLIMDEKGNLDFVNSSIYSQNKFKNISLLNYPFLKDILSYFQSNIITRNIVDISYYDSKIHTVNFNDFSSSVSMYNSRINFPKTNLKNNLLNFTFFGNYRLDNVVDYHLNFNWSDLKKKNQNSSKIVVENQTRGKQLFFKISGPIDQLKYEFDKEEIKNERKKKINSEKQIIKEIIKGETVIEEKEKEKTFEIEWQEDTSVQQVNEIGNEKNKRKIKKKDSSKLNKFLKKLGVEEEEKEKPKFEIDQ